MITATAVGRPTDEPTLKYLDDGTAVANCSLATEQPQQGGDDFRPSGDLGQGRRGRCRAAG